MDTVIAIVGGLGFVLVLAGGTLVIIPKAPKQQIETGKLLIYLGLFCGAIALLAKPTEYFLSNILGFQ